MTRTSGLVGLVEAVKAVSNKRLQTATFSKWNEISEISEIFRNIRYKMEQKPSRLVSSILDVPKGLIPTRLELGLCSMQKRRLLETGSLADEALQTNDPASQCQRCRVYRLFALYSPISKPNRFH